MVSTKVVDTEEYNINAQRYLILVEIHTDITAD